MTYLVLSSTILSVSACQKETSEQAPSSASTQAAQHAPADAVPGSHEDWCGEHQVPESMCTRCNQSLVAAFKATGDWCEDHGLPKSQCLTCDPTLKIERPPQKKGH